MDPEQICPNCKKRILRKGQKFCPYCRLRLVAERPTSGITAHVPTPLGERWCTTTPSRTPREIIFELGLALAAQARITEALEALEYAARESGDRPSASDIHFQQGRLAEAEGDLPGAFRSYLEGVRIELDELVVVIDSLHSWLTPEVIQAHGRWATREWAESMGSVNLEERQRLSVALFVGHIRLCLGEIHQAIRTFNRATRLLPEESHALAERLIFGLPLPPALDRSDDGPAQYILAQVRHAFGDLEGALELADKALQAEFPAGTNSDAPVYEFKGRLLHIAGRTEEAALCYYEAGQRFNWNNELSRSCKVLKRARKLLPCHASTYWELAEALRLVNSKNSVGEACDIWDSAARGLGSPDEPSGWPYLTRGLIAQQLANLPGKNRWDRYWEAVTFIEQALQLDPLRTFSWVSLGQIHYVLGNDLNALHAVETALLCEPEDVNAIEQHIILLTNLNRYAKVRPLLARRRTMEPKVDGWLNALEAHLSLYEMPQDMGTIGHEAALAASDAARLSGLDEQWSSIDRARLLRLLGRTDEAHLEYTRLSNKYKQVQQDRKKTEIIQDAENQLEYAWAALMIGEYDVAFNIFTERSGDRASGLSTIQRFLGFYHLLHGKLASARDHFNLAIKLANSLRELDAWLIGDFESAEVLQMLAKQPYAEQAREIIAHCKSSAINKRGTLHSPSSPLNEMQQLITALEANNEGDSWNWIGAHSVSARLNLETRCWNEAEQIYRKLQDYVGRFYTAQQGLEQCHYGLVAEKHLVAVIPDAARDAVNYDETQTSVACILPEDHTKLSDIHDRREYIERRRGPTRIFGQASMERLPAVTPIAIEASGNLRTLLQGDGSDHNPQFTEHLNLMRFGLHDLLGIAAPFVRVWINEMDLPDNTYIIMLNEIPIVSGNIDLTRGLCNATVDHLKLHNIKGEEAINPANGNECAWVDECDWQKVKDAGFDIWSPAEYIVLHISAVIRKNAAELVGLQAVAELLKDMAEEQYTCILSADGGLPRFTSVIQALLAEDVPIKELPSICNCYLENQSIPTYDIPEAIRCLEAVRKEIPGNTPDIPLYRLGNNFVTLIIEGIKHDGEAAVLALEPDPTQEALHAVRNEVANLSPTSRNPVIFVEDWRLRPFVRKLVELEFPYLWVLSRREALDPDSRPVLASIEVEPYQGSERR